MDNRARENRVEKGFEVENETDDLFEEAFGEDEEQEAAKQKMYEKMREIKDEKKKKKVKEEEEAKAPTETTVESPKDEDGDGEDDEDSEEDDVLDEAEEKNSEDDIMPPEMPEDIIPNEPEEKPINTEIKAKLKRIVKAKAKEAAEKDVMQMPLDKEVGVKEEDVKAPEKKAESEKKEGVAEDKPVEKKKSGIKPELAFLETDNNQLFIGRKKNVYQKYGEEGGLFIGRVGEEDLKDSNILLDSLNPHVVFVCGARGSGKSYILGVIAEELALKNKNVGTIVVDPIGVFWSMRFPNKETRELELLGQWELMPQGLENLKVFIPLGMRDKVPKNTYDATFSLPPAMLTAEDWCLTFGIERFSPSGLLLEKSLGKVKQGYKTKEGASVKGKSNFFSLENLIVCLGEDAELHSPDKGYKPDSIRALVSRFDAAKNWGVFDKKGTPLAELSRENQMAIIDTSFLEDNVSALVIGILARRILAARKISTRKEASNRMKEESIDQLLEEDIPPTWLFIDEAHTLIPSGNVRTPASTALVEYVKQGRQPGCSLVFATQQPSAIDTRVLSQLDTIVSHKLVFDDDIKAIYKRTPTIIPRQYKNSNFVKTLPVGVALTGDRREETSRAFIMRVRPRMSQHEGREAETVERSMKLDKEQVLKLAIGMSWAKLEREGSLETTTINEALRSLNVKYKSNLQLTEILEQLEKKGALLNVKTSTLSLPGKEHEEAMVEEISGEVEKEIARESKAVLQPEPIELLAFPTRVSQANASKIANKLRKKKFLGLIGEEEAIERISLKHLPVYRIEFNVFRNKNTFNKGEVFIDSGSGEFIHFNPKDRNFFKSKGVPIITNLKDGEVRALFALGRDKREFAAITKEIGETDMIAKKLLESLVAKGIASKEKIAATDFYALKKDIDLPKDPLHPLLRSLDRLPVSMEEALSIEMERFGKQNAVKVITKLWNKAIVKDVKDIYIPFYDIVLKKPNGKLRAVRIDATHGTLF
ncbi:MAG: hypothetical protein CL943_02425 [Candidatus Diapherotrites archaeon]|uniref:AAA+ ATPase domain-containing protein n=1 Tax=Candidatus Iainarchaeum sp. TaxID=3101447 RepID=A0A2D6M138_9ARCH|nr:hypothetical protein [Candidatus Diapherotrites archaeon]|tara:strand:- start:10031 stop:13000 length:2970 start_codon:yes stop_codon:yes gene_type:complete